MDLLKIIQDVIQKTAGMSREELEREALENEQLESGRRRDAINRARKMLADFDGMSFVHLQIKVAPYMRDKLTQILVLGDVPEPVAGYISQVASLGMMVVIDYHHRQSIEKIRQSVGQPKKEDDDVDTSTECG